MIDRVDRLETELAELREEFDNLKIEVGRLTRAVVGSSQSSRRFSSGGSNSRERQHSEEPSEFSLVDSTSLSRASATGGYNPPASSGKRPERAGTAAPSSSVISWVDRELIAVDIGKFFLRCL